MKTTDNETKIETKEIQSLNNGDTLLLSASVVYSKELIEAIEKELSAKTGKNVVVIDGRFNIVGII